MQVDVRVTGLDQTVKALQLSPGQLARATADSTNATALDFQKAQRERMGGRFTIRRKQWAERNVKVTHFAKATETPIHTTVAIEAPGDATRSDILSKFEETGTKKARGGGELAIPDQARRSKADVIRSDQRPKAFGFREIGSGSKGTVFVGKNRTFMVIPNGGKGGGIFQRTGRGAKNKNVAERGLLARGIGGKFMSSGKASRGSRRMAMGIQARNLFDVRVKRLFGFTRTARITERLGFYETAKRTASEKMEANANRALDKALARLGFRA
jgi:hypothetical protein